MFFIGSNPITAHFFTHTTKCVDRVFFVDFQTQKKTLEFQGYQKSLVFA